MGIKFNKAQLAWIQGRGPNPHRKPAKPKIRSSKPKQPRKNTGATQQRRPKYPKSFSGDKKWDKPIKALKKSSVHSIAVKQKIEFNKKPIRGVYKHPNRKDYRIVSVGPGRHFVVHKDVVIGMAIRANYKQKERRAGKQKMAPRKAGKRIRTAVRKSVFKRRK